MKISSLAKVNTWCKQRITTDNGKNVKVVTLETIKLKVYNMNKWKKDWKMDINKRLRMMMMMMMMISELNVKDKITATGAQAVSY